MTSLRIAIDEEGCVGHGRCFAAAPEVYVLDAEGYNRDRGSVVEVPAEEAEAARRGIRMCPEGAITLAAVRSEL